MEMQRTQNIQNDLEKEENWSLTILDLKLKTEREKEREESWRMYTT